MSKILPKELTSYDLLKTAAVIIMIIDHIGFFFFPEQNMWRAIGRTGFPVWFFLIGYAKGRDISLRLCLGALLMIVTSFMAGLSFFPLTALVTIIIIRVVLDSLMARVTADKRSMIAWTALLFLLILPTSILTEYGTQGIIFAMLGYMARHRERLSISFESFLFFAMFCFFSFVLIQHIQFAFSPHQLVVMVAGTFVITAILCVFRLVQYDSLTKFLPGFAVMTLQLGGRRTLEIYVVHLVLFKIIGIIMFPERFHFMEWNWFYYSILNN